MPKIGQENGRNANQGADGFSTPGPRGFEKADGKCTPTSSGQRTVYTGGRARNVPEYAPSKARDPRPDLKPASSRAGHRIGQRD